VRERIVGIDDEPTRENLVNSRDRRGLKRIVLRSLRHELFVLSRRYVSSRRKSLKHARDFIFVSANCSDNGLNGDKSYNAYNLSHFKTRSSIELLLLLLLLLLETRCSKSGLKTQSIVWAKTIRRKSMPGPKKRKKIQLY